MKRFLCFLLIFSLFPIICFSESEYSPALKMTMEDFVSKYNAIGAPLNSSYIPLVLDPTLASDGKVILSYFYPDSKSKVMLFLYTADPKSLKGSSAGVGLDEIQICMQNTEDFMSFLSIATRCVSLFSPSVLSFNTSAHHVTSLIKKFYENGAFGEQYYFVQIDPDNDIYLKYYYNGGFYYLHICPGAYL